MILNICVNAIHAIGEREGTICIRIRPVESGELAERHQLAEIPGPWKRFARVDIEDNGCGMTREVLDQIFDPFFTTKKNGKGTGLGLALVEQIVSSHKGYIFAESTPGEGSVFHIYFPVLEESGEIQETGTELKHSVLVVHSSAKVLRLLERNFSKIGISMTGCMNFEDAAEALTKAGLKSRRRKNMWTVKAQWTFSCRKKETIRI